MIISCTMEVNGAFDNIENVLRLVFLNQFFFLVLFCFCFCFWFFLSHVLSDCQVLLLLRVRGPSLGAKEFILSCSIQIDVDQETNSLNILELKIKCVYNRLLLIVRNFILWV